MENQLQQTPDEDVSSGPDAVVPWAETNRVENRSSRWMAGQFDLVAEIP